MAAPILPISPVTLPEAIRPAGQMKGGASFQDVFASASVERFLAGEGEELHTTILATQRAELSLELFLQARNKVVSAYQEIMRMQM